MNLRAKLKTGFIAAILSLSLIQCGEIRLIGAYDSNIDQGIQAVSKDVTAIFVQIDKNIDDATSWSFPVFKAKYVEVETELGVLTTRAHALPKYSIILSQLTILTGSVTTLEADHKSGFVASGAPVAALKAAIRVDRTAIETSIGAMLTLQEGLKRTKADKPATK